MTTKKSENLPTQPAVDPNQIIETNAYVPTYRLLPSFKSELLKSIGDRPFNEIAGIINAINVPVVDHNTLTQIINVIGQFPFVKVEKFLQNVNSHIEQVLED